MGVSSWMVRNILSSRGTRGYTGTDKGIKLDPSRGVAENVKEILISVSKKHGVSESHQIIYLNGFVKIITDENGDKDFGFPTEDILLCLRPAMVHESSLV
ncbi:rapamycin-insensitive companion of mTOR-like [Lycorma delicatula]|uniref:rapamycin-insensitive companion of mTOR-like n=1 Tax=Lycorma delicatula TaxID=130591 RepID=UPI003F50D92B